MMFCLKQPLQNIKVISVPKGWTIYLIEGDISVVEFIWIHIEGYEWSLYLHNKNNSLTNEGKIGTHEKNMYPRETCSYAVSAHSLQFSGDVNGVHLRTRRPHGMRARHGRVAASDNVVLLVKSQESIKD